MRSRSEIDDERYKMCTDTYERAFWHNSAAMEKGIFGI
jgi:hypothetical protein